jgi:hypothetical protein
MDTVEDSPTTDRAAMRHVIAVADFELIALRKAKRQQNELIDRQVGFRHHLSLANY